VTHDLQTLVIQSLGWTWIGCHHICVMSITLALFCLAVLYAVQSKRGLVADDDGQVEREG